MSIGYVPEDHTVANNVPPTVQRFQSKRKPIRGRFRLNTRPVFRKKYHRVQNIQKLQNNQRLQNNEDMTPNDAVFGVL